MVSEPWINAPKQTWLGIAGLGWLLFAIVSCCRALKRFGRCHKLTLATEYLLPDEDAHADSLIQILQGKMARDYPQDRMLRDAHPKMHGCVSAKFEIEPDLPKALGTGLFREPEVYQAWVRFSNQSGTSSPDYKADIRGVAIKLLGVNGEKLLVDDFQPESHDFILISDNRFVTKDIAEFEALIKASTVGTWRLTWFLMTHWRVARNLWMSLRRFANPLDIQYYSVSPYLLGAQAVKYSLRPRHTPREVTPPNPGEDYLREAMASKLDRGDVVFDFMVQVQIDAYDMPVEDLSVAWNEDMSPFQKVGTLTIPRQMFDLPERRVFGDNLSFNPWHCLSEHRPLGSINRARRRIYQQLSAFRHGRNSVPGE